MNRQEMLEKKAEKPIGIRPNGLPVKVTVVDDVFIDRRIMTQILRSAGFDVIAECGDGEEAVYSIKEDTPEIVILDYHMPKMNGLSALQEIRRWNPDIRVIMQTSVSEKKMAVTLIREGAADYIVKPVDRSVVLAKLRKLVRRIDGDEGAEE